MSDLTLIKKHYSFGGTTEFYSHQSSEIKSEMKFSVIRPKAALQNPNNKYPAVLWLSGLTCTEENFVAKAGAQRYADQYESFGFCPDTSPRGFDFNGEHDSYDFGSGAGFYLDATERPWDQNYRMQSYLIKDFLKLIGSEFPVDSKAIAISGHSMGGHGALTLGIKYPELFSRVVAFSPIVNPINGPWGQKAFTNYLGQDVENWKKYDACELILEQGYSKKIVIFQGSADEFLEKELLTDNFVKACDKKKVQLDLRICDGFDHSYYFISSYISEIFKNS